MICCLTVFILFDYLLIFLVNWRLVLLWVVFYIMIACLGCGCFCLFYGNVCGLFDLYRPLWVGLVVCLLLFVVVYVC